MANDSEQDLSNGRDSTVFFSYSRADQAIALPIIRLIEQAGFCTWWDGVLEAGVEYVETTEEVLETAKAVVVLWSKNSVGSHWVRDEAMSGRERKCLVPLSMDGSQPPLGFRQFQVIDMDGWRGDPQDEKAQQLLRAVAALHDREVVEIERNRPSKPLLASRRTALYLGIGGTILIAGGLAVSESFTDHNPLTGNGLVVLPFKNDSPDPDKQYLSEGLSSELRSTLARNPRLRVVARSSSEALAERALDAVSIARQLNVNFVIEGAVTVAGAMVEVTADLIDGATGVSRWSKTYNHALQDILNLQRTMADTISAELSQEVSAALRALRLGPATQPEAFDAYLRAWSLYRRSNSEATDLEVLSLFDRSIEIDPTFAAAHAGRALVLTTLGNTSTDVDRSQSYHDDAYDAAMRAAELGPDLDQVQSVLAVTLFHTRLDVRGAREPFDKSLELGGGSATIQARFAEYATLTGRQQEADRAMEIALDLDPLNPYVLKAAAMVHYTAGRYEQSIDLGQQALALDPSTSGANAWIGWAQLQLGKIPEAVESCLQEPYGMERSPCLAIAYFHLGDEAAAIAAQTELVEEYGDAGLYQQAQILAQWQRPDEAMALLIKAHSFSDAGLIYLGMDPLLEPLRSRPDFISLQDRLGFN